MKSGSKSRPSLERKLIIGVQTTTMFRNKAFEKRVVNRLIFTILVVLTFFFMFFFAKGFYPKTEVLVLLMPFVFFLPLVLINIPFLLKAHFDLSHNSLEITGKIKKKGVWHWFRPTSYFVTFEEINGKFYTDSIFYTKTRVGQKVRVFYTSALKMVKEWELVE